MHFIGYCENDFPKDKAIYDIDEKDAVNFLFGKEEALKYIKNNNLVPVISNITIDEAQLNMKILKL